MCRLLTGRQVHCSRRQDGCAGWLPDMLVTTYRRGFAVSKQSMFRPASLLFTPCLPEQGTRPRMFKGSVCEHIDRAASERGDMAHCELGVHMTI